MEAGAGEVREDMVCNYVRVKELKNSHFPRGVQCRVRDIAIVSLHTYTNGKKSSKRIQWRHISYTSSILFVKII